MSEPEEDLPETAEEATRTPLLAIAVILGLIAVHFILYVLLPGDQPPTAGDDLRSYYYPAYESTYQQIREGSLPLWNPYQLCGLPRVGVIQGGFFYPLHLIYVFFETSIAMVLSALIHLAIAAVSGMLLARRLGMLWASSLFAALLLAMRGDIPMMLQFPNMMEAAVWTIPGCIAIVELTRGRVARPIALLSICIGMSVLAGYPQATVYAGYTWGALMLGLLALGRPLPRIWASAVFGLVAAVLLGSMLAAIQMAPTLELSELGNRKIESLTIDQMFPMGWPNLSVGETLRRYYDPMPDQFGLPLYMGVVAICLIPAGWLLGRNRRLNILLTGIGTLALIVTLGPITPFFDVYRSLPLLDSFRLPIRMRFVVDICFALAAAGGLDAVLRQLELQSRDPRNSDRDGSSSRRWLLWGVPAVAAIPVVIHLAETRGGSARIAVLLALLLIVAAAKIRTRRQVTILGGVVLALAVAEIASRPTLHTRISYMQEEELGIFTRDDEIFAVLRDSPNRILVHSFGYTPELPAKLPSTQRFKGLGDYEPATTRRQSDYFDYLNRGEKTVTERVVPFSGGLRLLGMGTDPDALERRSRLLDLTGLRYVLTFAQIRGQTRLGRYLKTKGYEQIRQQNGIRLWERSSSLPRAYVVHDVREAPETAQLLALISHESYDPLAYSFVEGAPEMPAKPGRPPRGAAAEFLFDQPDHIRLHATLSEPGMLVLADTFYPGWHASVDGEPAEILPANHLFRGVMISEPGEHEIDFRYRPRSIEVGAGISLAALVGCTFLALGPWSRVRSG